MEATLRVMSCRLPRTHATQLQPVRGQLQDCMQSVPVMARARLQVRARLVHVEAVYSGIARRRVLVEATVHGWNRRPRRST